MLSVSSCSWSLVVLKDRFTLLSPGLGLEVPVLDSDIGKVGSLWYLIRE